MTTIQEQHKKLTDTIWSALEEFEKESGCLVSSEMHINRGGVSDSIPYRIYGIHIPITPR
jgi:hypothetical protein